MLKRRIARLILFALALGLFPGAGVPVSADSVPDIYLIAEFQKAADVTAFASNLAADTVNIHAAPVAARWQNTTTSGYVQFNTPQFTHTNWSDYNYYYAWVYSGAATNAKINLLFYCPPTGSTNNYYRTTFDVNWTGWKLMEFRTKSIGVGGGSPNWGHIDFIRYNATGWSVPSHPDTLLVFDRFFVTKEQLTPFIHTKLSIPANYDDAPLYGDVARFTFSHPVSPYIKSGAVTLTETATGETVPARGTAREGSLSVSPDGTLKPATAYTVTLGAGLWGITGQTLPESLPAPTASFTTTAEPLSVSDLTVSDSAGDIPFVGDPLVAAAQVTNTHPSQALDASLVVAWYDSGNLLLGMESKPVSPGPGQTVPVSLFVPGTAGAAYTKVFAITGDDAPALAGDRFLTLDNSGLSQNEIQPIAIPGPEGIRADSVGLAINTVTMEGTVTGAFTRPLLIACADSGGGFSQLAPLMPGTDGRFSYAFGLSPTAGYGGEQAVTISARHVPTPYTTSFYYPSQTEKDGVLTTVNTASGAMAVENLLKERYATLGLPQNIGSAPDFQNMAAVLYQQKPYATFEEAAQMLFFSRTLLSDLNTTDWGVLHEFLTTHEAIIMVGSAQYGYYQNLAADVKISISKNIMASKPFSSFAAFCAHFDAQAQAYKDSLSGGGGGGGGGGKSTPISSYQIPNPELIPPASLAPAAPLPFTDLQDAAWAADSVARLLERGVISASPSFRPLDRITREEFVKLLVLSLGLLDQDAASPFEDVPADKWYYPYVASAYKAGIVSGISNTSFGVSQSISRQDMAVLSHRALTRRFPTFTAKPSGTMFTDDEAIAGYARESVYAMRGAGILSGMENGTFAPTEFASRAQGAKMIAGLLDKIQ